jgi:hypothetical protein
MWSPSSDLHRKVTDTTIFLKDNVNNEVLDGFDGFR